MVNLDLIEKMVKKGAKVVLFYPENTHTDSVDPYFSYSAVILGDHSTDTVQLSSTAQHPNAISQGKPFRESAIKRIGQLVAQEIYGAIVH